MKPAPKYFAVRSCSWQSQCCLLLTACAGGWRERTVSWLRADSLAALACPGAQLCPGFLGS